MKLDIFTLVATVLAYFRTNKLEPISQHDSLLTGDMYYDELMNTDNPSRFLIVSRMNKATFITF
jgi:hypothetical protein